MRRSIQQIIGDYPWDAVFLSMTLVVLIVVLGSFAVDAAWQVYWDYRQQPSGAIYRGTCYWMDTTRELTSIAADGYSDYDPTLVFRHLTTLPNRSWWPVYVNLTALTLRLTGGHYCSGWLVNLIAMVLLPPVIQGITKTRRPLLMTGVALLPFGTWLYGGTSEGTFLLFSGMLLWLSLRRQSDRRGINILWSVLGLAMGIVLGLTKPNVIVLLPGFGLLAISRTMEHLRIVKQANPGQSRSLRRRFTLAIDDTNPGWTALLGVIGILIGLGLWFYQTSGYYPLYVVMAQHTLWHKEFDSGNLLAFTNHIMRGWWSIWWGTGLPLPLPWNMMEFAVLNLMGILVFCDLPPRWPGVRPHRKTPLYAAIGMLSAFGLMIASGQAHSIERYLVSNIFFVTTFLLYVYGRDHEPPLAELPRLIRERGPNALGAVLRLTVFACGLALLVLETIIMIVYGS